MKYLLTGVFIIMSYSMTAQHSHAVTAASDTVVYEYVEQMPEPSFYMPDYLLKNINCPDSFLLNHCAPGKIAIRFIVYGDGHTGNFAISRSSGVAAFDYEVIKALSKMPVWKPGKHNGKPVKVLYTLPLTIHLE